ncbi:unnamed protein product, partial [Timema podura]|nr:unnamed protein product [Timema podura]
MLLTNFIPTTSILQSLTFHVHASAVYVTMGTKYTLWRSHHVVGRMHSWRRHRSPIIKWGWSPEARSTRPSKVWRRRTPKGRSTWAKTSASKPWRGSVSGRRSMTRRGASGWAKIMTTSSSSASV